MFVCFLSIFCRCFPWSSVEFSSIFCRCLLDFLSIFCPYSVRIQSVLWPMFTRTSTSPLCASRFVHSQAVPLVVSSHLLNIPLNVPRLTIILCNRSYKIIYISIIIPKVDLKKCLSVRCRFSDNVSSVFYRFSFYFLSMFDWFSFYFLSLYCPYYRSCS